LSGIQIAIHHQATKQARIGAMLQGHALLDMPTARTPFGGKFVLHIPPNVGNLLVLAPTLRRCFS